MNDYRLKNNELFKKKIQFYTKKYIKKIKQFERIEFKELNLLIRKKYYKERVLLFGDALHIVHPFVGQGFNMVVRDLKNLNEILSQKINLGLDIGSIDILGEFSNKTKSRNFIYSLGIDFIKDLFSKNLLVNDFRNKIMTMINRNNSTKDMFFNLADKGFRF
jgi:2-octaprenyl-6-methoxyphenol hydroxylase